MLNFRLGQIFEVSKMQNSWWLYFCLLIFIIMLTCPVFTHGNAIDRKVLHVGHELWKETLPLQMGSCLYKLRRLKPHSWYEVKISYPASIPSSFSLQLKRGSSDLRMNTGRNLLNTEKLIFRTDGIDSLSDKGLHVLVNVEPEGVVAITGKQKRKFVIFNIVCDELFVSIPREAWYVVLFVLLCLGLAIVIPSFLPLFLLPKNGIPSLTDGMATKDT